MASNFLYLITLWHPTGSSPECASTLHNKCDVHHPSARHRCSWHRSFTATASISTSFPLFPYPSTPFTMLCLHSAVMVCEEISTEYENLCLDQHQVPMGPQPMPSSNSRPPFTSSRLDTTRHDVLRYVLLIFLDQLSTGPDNNK